MLDEQELLATRMLNGVATWDEIQAFIDKNYVAKEKIRKHIKEYIELYKEEQDKADNEELIATEMDIRKNQIYPLKRILQELLNNKTS